jgi:hypothetical protein
VERAPNADFARLMAVAARRVAPAQISLFGGKNQDIFSDVHLAAALHPGRLNSAKCTTMWSAYGAVCETAGFTMGTSGRPGSDPLTNPAVYESRWRLRRRRPGVSAGLSPGRTACARRATPRSSDLTGSRAELASGARCRLASLTIVQLASAMVAGG